MYILLLGSYGNLAIGNILRLISAIQRLEDARRQ